MIELTNITQIYAGPQGPVRALDGIDLKVASGEIFGVIGRSGAGKSSLVRTINLLNRPTTGSVRVAGQELTTLKPAALRAARHKIGMVFQHFNLLSSLTVAGNVALPLKLAGVPQAQIRERVASLLDLVGLTPLSDRYPAQISGGQKQRVGIARALAGRPQVLLSDEATSALDPETTRSILALLARINRELGLTIVLITHQMQVIKQIANRVAVIDHGQIVEQGSVVDVFTRPQQAITRSLLSEIVPQEIPESVITRLRAQIVSAPPRAGQSDSLLRLSFAGGDAERPLLSELVRKLELDLNLLHGQVDDIQGIPFASMAVHLRGTKDRLDEALLLMRAAGATVQNLDLTGLSTKRHDNLPDSASPKPERAPKEAELHPQSSALKELVDA